MVTNSHVLENKLQILGLRGSQYARAGLFFATSCNINNLLHLKEKALLQMKQSERTTRSSCSMVLSSITTMYVGSHLNLCLVPLEETDEEARPCWWASTNLQFAEAVGFVC